jgi:hypothetical protein
LVRMRRIIFTISLLLIFPYCSLPPLSSPKKTKVQKFLSELSKDEKFLLEYFFRCLIQEDAIGYSLINAKPMSFFSYIQPKIITLQPHEATPVSTIEFFSDGFTPRYAIFHKGFEIWKKYEYLFCGNNIVFDYYEEEGILSFRKVVVLNKRLLLPLFEQHLQNFQRIDGSLKDSNCVFKALIGNEKFKRKFHSSTALVGICLGYGEKNARLFEEMVHIFSSQGLYGFRLGIPSPPEHQKALEEKLAALQATFNGVCNSHKSKKFQFSWGPSFRADFTDPETHLLREKYMNASKTLSHHYENKSSFLEKTLDLIIAADSE